MYMLINYSCGAYEIITIPQNNICRRVEIDIPFIQSIVNYDSRIKFIKCRTMWWSYHVYHFEFKAYIYLYLA